MDPESPSVTWLPTRDPCVRGLSFFPAGVLLHVMGDALGSVVVVITAIIFYTLPLKDEDPCNWKCYIDPSLTIIMVIIILSSAFPLIKETAVILLQMVPKGIKVEELSKSGGSELAPLSTPCPSGRRPGCSSEQRLICVTDFKSPGTRHTTDVL